MDNLARVKRKAFIYWLRTGHWLRSDRTTDTERKFNPNHDPTNGRFASGAGAGGFQGGPGGSFGGGGSSDHGLWGNAHGHPGPSPTGGPPAAFVGTAPPAVAAPAGKPGLRHVISNGYDYAIDDQTRTRSVSGDLTYNPANQDRSRRAQREAGGDDRLPSDDGGHYIAPRFNGPTEAYNHFAQDSNVNRGRYRALEDQWAREKRAGKDITVRINPFFTGSSKRPSSIDVIFYVDDHKESVKLPN